MRNSTGSPIPQKTTNVLESDRIGPLLFKLSLPAFIGMFVQTMYNVVNTIFIGRFVGPEAITGLSLVFPLQMLVAGSGMLIGMGGSSVISRYIGSRNIRGAEHALGNGITAGIVLPLIVMIIILVPVNFWLRLIGASDDSFPFAKDYLVIVISFTIFNVLGMILLTFVRSEGNARVGMIGMLAGAILNIILDAIFIIHFNWGVKGAALGTGISQTVSMIYLLIYYLNGNSYLKIHFRNLKPDLSILKPMFSIGIAAFAQTTAGSISALLIIHNIVVYGGDSSMGAFGIIQRVMLLSIMPGIVIAQGAQPIIGFNYGAKRYSLVLKTLRIAAISSTIFSVVSFLVLYFLPRPIISIFTDDPELISTGTYSAKLIFLSLPLIGSIMLGNTLFQATGKSVQSFITAIVRPVIFLLPLVLLLSRTWQLDGIFLAFPIADLLTFLLTLGLLIPVFKGFSKAAALETDREISPAAGSSLLKSPQRDPAID
jgi:putative MATE family efflux protein